nr:MAG TPA: tail tape measure protein [Caudoviricetes sp.]
MAKQTRREIYITCNGKSADDMLRTLTNHAAQLDKQIKKLIADGKGNTKEYRELVSVHGQLKKQLKQNISNTQMIDKVMRNLAGSTTSQLRKALQAVNREISRSSEASGKLPKLRKQYEALKAQIDKNTGAIHKQGGAWSTAMNNLVAYVGLFGAFNMLKSKLTDAIKLNLKYSDSLADIRKVSNLSMNTVNELSRMLAKVDSRTSLEGLTQLAYVGSRMGMGKYGAEGLYEFAKASDRVNVALHEDLGDDAMLTLSKFVETMGEVERHGGNISDAFDSVASSIFKLASSSTSNGGNILEFSKRLTGLAKVTKVTSAQLLGLASASDSLMLMPEVASTAFGKFFSSLWNNYHEIEAMLGMQRDSLKGMIKDGRTMDALVEVLRNVSDKNLNSMDEYFKEFGSDGQRLKQVIVTMAQNVNVLEQHLATSNEAYKDGTAVVKEYKIQQQTAQAILERANNLWEKAFVSPEGIESVKEMAKLWYDFSKNLTQSKGFMLSVRFFFFELTMAVKTLLSVLPGLVAYFGTKGLIAVFTKLIPMMAGLKFATMAKGIVLATQALMGNAVAVQQLTVKWKALNLAMKTNVIGLVLSVVASLGFGLYEMMKNTDKASNALKRFDGSLDGVKAQANQAVGELKTYYEAVQNAEKGTNQRLVAIKQFNEKFGSYISNLITEKSTAKEVAKAYQEASEAIKAKIYLQMKQKDIQKQYAPRVGWSLDRLDEYAKVAKGTNDAEWLKAFELDSRGKSLDAIVKQLAKKLRAKNLGYVLNSLNEGYDKAVEVSKTTYQTSAGTTNTLTHVYDLGGADERLFRALRYVYQMRSAEHFRSKVEKKFEPVQEQIDAYLEGLGGTSKNDLTQPSIKPEKEKKIAQDRVNALVSNIKAFYEEQMRKYLEWVAQMNADGEKISEGQQKEQMDYLQSQMDRALGVARQSIVTLDDGWKEFYSHMNEDVMVYNDETSKQLLESIGKADIGGLRKLFAKLSADLSLENNRTLAENIGSLLDQFFANGSKELREAAEKLLARQREIQKILNEHDYTGAVDRKTRSDFDRIGFLHPAENVRPDSAEGLATMNDAFDKLTAKARQSVAELYSLNPEGERFQDQFLQFLDVANEGFDFSVLKVQDLKALYLELIKYNAEYESATKKEDDERKKLNDYAWSKDDGYKRLQGAVDAQDLMNKESSRQYAFGAKGDAISPWGQTEASDPELELLKLKFDLAKEYYAFIDSRHASDEQKITAAQSVAAAHSSLMDAVVAKAKATADAQRKWYKPIEQYGSALGEAMVDESKSVKDASRSMISSFIDLTGEYVQQKLTQWIMTKLYNSLIASSEQELVAEKQAAAAENATTAVTEAGVEVTAGTASGAAKTIGELGWWGIPLIAAIGAVLGGLMSLAKGALSNAFGGKSAAGTKNNIKVTSGMLTYDAGNVQDFSPYVSENGSLYWAKDDDGKQHHGVNLLSVPTATSINGRPSLVAENGPEIVIGRETTKAMMIDEPQLFKTLVNFDRNHSGRRAYDAGNVADAAAIVSDSAAHDGAGVSISGADAALLQAVNALLQRLEQPIEAKIDMYGRGKLYDSMTKANQFMKNK